MSYDLYFKSREGSTPVQASDLAGFFRQRQCYEVSNQQAVYQNEATGVYFVFDIGAPEIEESPDLAPLAFNLNYFRPHIFGLEAEPEVKAVVQQFNFLVSDPQIDGMGDGEYSSEAFLSGWNRGNQFGYESILSQNPDQQPTTLPTARIESYWRWNLFKDSLQTQLGEDIFVPRVMFIRQRNTVQSAVVWPDGIPIAIPTAELVIIQRKQILPKKLFSASEDMVVAAWADVEPVVETFPLEKGPLPYRSLQYSATPDSVVAHLRSLRPTKEKLEGVGVDQILNAELVEAARASSTNR